MTFPLKNQNKKGREIENVLQVWIHTRHLSLVEPHSVSVFATAAATLQIRIRSAKQKGPPQKKKKKKKKKGFFF